MIKPSGGGRRGVVGLIVTPAAVVAVAGFVYWLSTQSRQVREERAERFAAAVEAESDLDAADLAADPVAALGRRVVISGVAVATGLGDAAFALRLPNEAAYPVLMESMPIQRLRMSNTTIYGGDSVFVSGHVFTFNDSISNAWITQGAVNEGMGELIPQSPTFLLADSVVVH